MNEFCNEISIRLLQFHRPESHNFGHRQPMFNAFIERESQ